ncbi:MAG: HNH endonuclease family protein [Candidatus Thorarchaeota archaeon]
MRLLIVPLADGDAPFRRDVRLKGRCLAQRSGAERIPHPRWGQSPGARVIAGFTVFVSGVLSLGAEVPDGTSPQIEHVMPQTLSDEWDVEEEEQKALLHTWGNLVPLTGEKNAAVGQRGYEHKRKILMKAAMYSSPRRLAEQFGEWGPDQIRERSRLIAEWAMVRWPKKKA